MLGVLGRARSGNIGDGAVNLEEWIQLAMSNMGRGKCMGKCIVCRSLRRNARTSLILWLERTWLFVLEQHVCLCGND